MAPTFPAPGPTASRCCASRRTSASQAAATAAFLDDDGWYSSPELGTHLRELFMAEPDLGIVSFRVRDPEGGPGERRHVPRLRAGDPLRSSDVTTVLGGACAMRRVRW